MDVLLFAGKLLLVVLYLMAVSVAAFDSGRRLFGRPSWMIWLYSYSVSGVMVFAGYVLSLYQPGPFTDFAWKAAAGWWLFCIGYDSLQFMVRASDKNSPK